MRVVRERRSPAAKRLRIYIDAIKDAEATTNEIWLEVWAAHCDADNPFIPRMVWIAILKYWALQEASKLAGREAA